MPSTFQYLLARKIQHTLGGRIAQACKGSLVPEAFLAGLISVEDARLDIHASRFEKGVYEKLKALRNPLVLWKKEWNGIKRSDMKGLSDAALVNLASSFGYTQIMGWHTLHDLRCSVADLRNPELHLMIAVNLLHMVASPQLRGQNFPGVLRVWNTGSPTGTTFDSQYCSNGIAVMRAYNALLVSIPPQPTHGAPAQNPTI